MVHTKYTMFSCSLKNYALCCLKDSAFDPKVTSAGLSPGRQYYVVFLGKPLYSHGASLHPFDKTVLPNLMLGVTH